MKKYFYLACLLAGMTTATMHSYEPTYPNHLYIGGDAEYFRGPNHSSEFKRLLVVPFMRYEYLSPDAFYLGIDFGGYFDARLGYTFAFDRDLLTTFVGYESFSTTLLPHQMHLHPEDRYFTCGLRYQHKATPTMKWGINIKLLESFRVAGYEAGIPLTWYLGFTNKWVMQLEPYYFKPDAKHKENIIGSRLLFGYRF